jgi:hypothetical protein
MEIVKKLTIRPETIETLYEYYIGEKLLVNRKYQRKLVWSIEEKQSFIDSISLNYPIPLFLVAEVPFNSDVKFEIIDGMQRLNAIFAFIEGEFPIQDRHFDLETIGTTKYLKDSEKLIQKLPKLERTFCKNITSYPLPLSVSNFDEHEKIEDIFTRINSNGKHLSSQELRQAGSNTLFGGLVRKISESIRGDVSLSDRLLLNKMKNISINNHDLKYGINMGGIFWRKHNIITNENIRQSRDEEMVAHLLSGMLIEPRPNATSHNLDKFYGLEGNNVSIEEKIRKLGEKYITTVFQATFDEFRKTFESTGSSFFKIAFHKETKYVSRSFQAAFLAFYDLLVKEQMKIIDYVKLAKAFEGFGDKYLTNNSEYLNHSKEREQAIEAIKGIARKHFVRRKGTDPALNNGVIKLENILNSSDAETINYDFKIGFHRLEKEGKFDDGCLAKSLRTLTAIANAGKESVGYVIIGVADSDDDKKRFESFYGSKAIQHKNFFITGLNDEIKKYSSAEDYKRHLEVKIKASGITPSIYVDQILRNIDYFNYYDKNIVILKIQSEDEPAKFGDKYFERLSSNTLEISRDKEKQLWKRFIK